MIDLNKRLTIDDLICQTDKFMIETGYSAGTMRHWRESWNVLKQYADRHGEVYLTSELGMAMLKEHYNIEMYSTGLSGYKNQMRRSVMLLLEYQLTGHIAKRNPKVNHAFPEQYHDPGEKFIQHLRVDRALSEGTIRNYHLTLEKFFSFAIVCGAGCLGKINAEIINAYIKTLAGYSKSHARNCMNALSSFFVFATDCGYDIVKYKWPSITTFKDKSIPEYYTSDEIERILNVVDRANPRGKRDYAIMLLAIKYGLRVGDIRDMKFSNIDFVKNEISLTQQKTQKHLTLPLLPDVGWAIIDYIKNGRPESDVPSIFIRHVVPYIEFSHGDNLGYILSGYARQAGVRGNGSQKNSFHMLRYSLASNLLRKNISLSTISGILGHSEINTTAQYTRLDFDQLKECALEVPV